MFKSQQTNPKQLQAALEQKQQVQLLRRQEVERLTSLSRSRIYELMSLGLFPKQVRLGAKSVAWISHEIQAWIAERIAARTEVK